MKVFFFTNGNTACLDEGRQRPELQVPWLLPYLELLEREGIDPTRVEFNLPGGVLKARPFRTTEGDWNWEVS